MSMTKLRMFKTDKLVELLRDTLAKESINWSERKSKYWSHLNDEQAELVKRSERDEIVAFILEVCEREDMHIGVDTFALFVSLLDRFLSNYKVKSKYLECLAVGCFYIACKVKEDDEKISVTAEFLLDCNCKCSVGELLRMEQMILSKFEWNVNDVTATDFVYLFYSLLHNEYSACQTSVLNGSVQSPAADFDFVAALEYKLKQCLCVCEFANNYRPTLLAYSLMALQLDEYSLSEILRHPLDALRDLLKLAYEEVDKCKEQIKQHLINMEDSKNLYDLYLKDFYRNTASCSSLFTLPPLPVSNLDVIEEEEEQPEDEQSHTSIMDQQTVKIPEPCPSELTYADVVLGRPKRKRSSNSSSDDDIDYD